MSPEPLRHDVWMNVFFGSYYAHRPVNATFIGAHDFDDRLPDFSESAVGDVLAEAEDLTRRAPTAPAADRAEAIDRRLALGQLDIQRWELSGHHFHRGNPSLYTGEAVFGVIGLFLTDYAPLDVRVEAAISRLDAIPAFLAQARRNVVRAPRAWTERAIRECEGALALLTDHFADGAARGSRRRDALALAAHAAAVAFAEHRARLVADLLNRPSEEVACGPEALDTIVRRGHFLEEDAEEIARYAEDELSHAESRLARGAQAIGAASPAEALARLAEVHPSTDRYHAGYEEVWRDMRGGVERAGLVTWPKYPIRYVPRPTWVRAAAPYLYFLFYRAPAAFGAPPVHEYLIAPLPDDPAEHDAFLRVNNAAVVKLNHVIHHGGLGHHVQNWHAQRAASRIGQVAAVDCASRIAMLCGGTMAEGWACYATDLSAESGLLTPLEELSEVHGRVRMAARALVDVRLHRGELTLDEAASVYQARAGMSEAAARAEAVKNSMFPGAALMYLMGTDAIHRLRRDVRRQRGDAFDLRGFHDELLSWGSIPVSLIAEEMTAEQSIAQSMIDDRDDEQSR
jgi:hypothetical protein